MILELILALLIGLILGALLHKRVVKEDLKIAAIVKKILGAKIAAIKIAEAKAVAEVKKPE